MSRQPRKVFGFTGSAKYGPVANEGEKNRLVAPGTKSDMKRDDDEDNSSSNSFDCYKCLCDPNGTLCTFITCCGICKNIDCSSICQ